MIKETLIKLIENNYSTVINRNAQYLIENFDESQLEVMLTHGFDIEKNIKLYYYVGSGYRCINERAALYGNNPMCIIIERALNKELLKS